MRTIIAIGGGEIGRPGFPIETTSIDKEIISLNGKKKPKVLFVPTASSDSEPYFEVVKKHFGKRLGCAVDVLYLLKNKQLKEKIEKKILSHDIIYVGGGNTLKMMRAWRKLGVDKMLLKACEKGIVLSGVSAGAMCWFSFGLSDSLRFSSKNAPMIKVRGLSIVNALFCPHYDIEKKREPELKKMMKKDSGIAIAVENCCAVEIIGGNFRVISSKKTAKAYKVYWENGKYFKKEIPKQKKFLPIKELVAKN
ncbi:peptidase E [Candidatus Parcubacteria bacterium]|nr:peptidase E [Patescibacteria group bacterium]MBU4141486.1 peptidase E [Patescibacteria group bacterium]MBU4338073.1 peptidase E [Patescibacteria group bacterium]MBU4580373.1 peptidase E [Patescibacteria group bacterium]MCG2686884.1 peptidase E [Candidatus Parcubacteria bacterium]